MKKIIVIFFIALFGLSIYMVGRKVVEYGLVKGDTIYVEKARELDKDLEKAKSEVEEIKNEKKDELKRLEEWEKLVKEAKENL